MFNKNSSPKPLHVLQVVATPVGGIRRHVHCLLFGLSGIKQSYACSVADGDAVFNSELPELERFLSGRILKLAIKKKPAFSDMENIARLKSFIKENGITIVHGHGAKGGAYARMLAGYCGVKSVYTPHGGAVHKMFMPHEELIYRTAENSLFSSTDYFVFESEYSKKAYIEKTGKLPEKFLVNYNGIKAPDIAVVQKRSLLLGYPAAPGIVPEVGIFGMLRSQKGQASAIAAVQILRKRGINIKLNLFGEGGDRETLKTTVLKMGISRFVKFHGEVSDAEAHMFAMDLVLIPSLFESFGYVALEAFSLNKPVAAANVGGLTEIIKDRETGLLFEAGNPEKIADSVQMFLSDTVLRARIIQNASLRLEKDFSQSVMLANLEKVYQSLINDCRNR